MVTGTSVIGVTFDKGVMLAADTLGSYGSLARFKSVSRMKKVTDNCAVAASGDYADFQYMERLFENLTYDPLTSTVIALMTCDGPWAMLSLLLWQYCWLCNIVVIAMCCHGNTIVMVTVGIAILLVWHYCCCCNIVVVMVILLFISSIESDSMNDGHGYTPTAIFSWLTRVMYNRRSKINPLWNTVIVGGYHERTP